MGSFSYGLDEAKRFVHSTIIVKTGPGALDQGKELYTRDPPAAAVGDE
jgi:hypothetical protein